MLNEVTWLNRWDPGDLLGNKPSLVQDLWSWIKCESRLTSHFVWLPICPFSLLSSRSSPDDCFPPGATIQLSVVSLHFYSGSLLHLRLVKWQLRYRPFLDRKRISKPNLVRRGAWRFPCISGSPEPLPAFSLRAEVRVSIAPLRESLQWNIPRIIPRPTSSLGPIHSQFCRSPKTSLEAF